jgi:preprotein translocase subunit SecF
MWPFIRLIPVNTHFPFVKFAKYASTISIILIVASLVSLWKPGLNLGIDFKGGSRVEMNTPGKALDFKLVENTLLGLGLKDVKVQAVGAAGAKGELSNSSAQAEFQTPQGRDASAAMTQAKTALTKVLGNVAFTGDSVVGPTISGELMGKGVMALAIAIVLMLFFVWFRFRLSFGLGAVAALFHDVILTFGLVVLLRLEFTLDVIAAILTIIGYSMNDTVVVFDRLRENLRKYKKMPLRDVIDLSVNETLSRTVITGLTAVLALAGLAVFGGPSLFPMAVALLFGIVVGTYSSIYIASPIVLLWGIKRGEDDDKAKPIDWTPSMMSGGRAPKRK